ncbi:hypothetical protein HDU88_001568 [Geranomyces variabilis]|nr:hypothetical protein HDU88_001568 [Geranomyces variabilis]
MAANDIQIAAVPGLRLINDFISEEEATFLLQTLDSLSWGGNGSHPNPELKRRTLVFGHHFSFVSRTIVQDLGPLPDFLTNIISRMREHGVFAEKPPELCLVNEYEPGQGIMPHVDAPSFGPIVTSLSLMTPCVMNFTPTHSNGSHATAVLLKPRSLLVLSGEARFHFKHGIGKELFDLYQGQKVERGRRVSLTFRTLSQPQDAERRDQ